MSVTLLRPYMGFATGAVVTLPDSTETALIAQGFATAGPVTSETNLFGGPDQYLLQGGNRSVVDSAGFGTPTYMQGPRRLPVIALGSAALTGYETNGVAQTAGTWNQIDIFVPYLNTWTGIAVLQGTTVGTNKLIGAIYGTSGALLANSAVAGVTTSGASTFLSLPFTTAITLVPGRYILAVQADGNTDTIRHVLSANGSIPDTATLAGTFATVPATITPPSSFTTALGPICMLYT